LSQCTIGRRIQDLSNDVEEKLKEKAANFQFGGGGGGGCG
jgi:hypothetical protein